MKALSRDLFFMVSTAISIFRLAEEMQFQPWPDSFLQVEKEFGNAATGRLRKLYDLMVENRDKPVAVRLSVVNDATNQLPWNADRP